MTTPLQKHKTLQMEIYNCKQKQIQKNSHYKLRYSSREKVRYENDSNFGGLQMRKQYGTYDWGTFLFSTLKSMQWSNFKYLKRVRVYQ